MGWRRHNSYPFVNQFFKSKNCGYMRSSGWRVAARMSGEIVTNWLARPYVTRVTYEPRLKGISR